MLVPFIGIVISCNLLGIGAQKFFWESVLHAAGGQLPEHPLTSVYAERLISAIGVLAPIAAVSLLPSGIFQPPGRSATIAAILVVAAAWAFYGAAIGVPVHFFTGALVIVSLELGLKANALLGIATSIVIICLMLFFWLRITLSVLELSGAKVLGISIVVIIAEALLAAFFAFVVLGSP